MESCSILKGIEKNYGIGTLPALVQFSDGIPVLFHDDLDEYEEVLEWILENLEVRTVSLVFILCIFFVFFNFDLVGGLKTKMPEAGEDE